MLRIRFATPAWFGALAVCLLILTTAWHIPMMLWDHLDLVPIFQAWKEGSLAGSGFWKVHGGHMHTAAYAVLLFTTYASGGQPWLDCLVSWLLLLCYASVVMLFARETFRAGTRRDLAFTLFIVFLALYPGHLANLQWGWQVAVFLCLAGAVTTILCLTRTTLNWQLNALALAAAAIAFFSFATAIALFPTALALIALRVDRSRTQRVMLAVPWATLSLAILLQYRSASTDTADSIQLATYVLNFIGAGISRFVTNLAPWLALAAITSGFWAFARARRQRECLPWFGLAVFAMLAGILIALGRAAPFGSEHAFVTRYVSFSSMFWLGWAGLIGCAMSGARTPHVTRIGAWLVALLAVANAAHMMKKAAGVAANTRAIAQNIRATYPYVDEKLLGEIYFDEPDVAKERLHSLHAWGFPPFGVQRSPPRDVRDNTGG